MHFERAQGVSSAVGVAAGRLSWEVTRSFDFADAPVAYAAILDGHTRGKSALTFS